jgi:adenine phosphoribosyltransferase
MAELHDSLETGENCEVHIPGLPYPLSLPWVWLLGEDQDIRIASLNLVGKIKWNQDLGKLITAQIKKTVPDLDGICFITAVEKALQLAQVVASELGVQDMAVAYNRIKPHMEPERRPVIQVGSDSVTSGIKFLALYERDINLIVTTARRGVIIIDDVVTTGGTILGLMELLDEMAQLKELPRPIPVHGIFCVAEEGKRNRVLPAPVYALARLPDPILRKPGSIKGKSLQERLWPKP